MSGGMNIDEFKLSGDGISLSDFTAKVNSDKELINIYKAFDKNGDNKLSRDELASLLGAYKMFDSTGDGTLSTLEAASFNQKISMDIARDSNSANDNLVINFNKFNDFFSSLKTLIDPNSAKSGDVYYYDKDGKITGGKKMRSGEFTRVYTDNGYTDTFKNGGTSNYDKDGKWLSGKTQSGDKYTVIYNQDGSCVAKIESYKGDPSKPYEWHYHADGKCTGGKDIDGNTWTRTYKEDGSYTEKYDAIGGNPNNKQEKYYDADGNETGGKLSNNGPLDTEFTVKYDEEGNETYTEFTKSDGTKYFYYYDNNDEQKKASTAVDAKGNIMTSAKEGESFQETMQRLGITDPADIAIFKIANPMAARNGWFLAGAEDVKIPASIASKLDYANMMVNADEQAEAYRRNRSGS